MKKTIFLLACIYIFCGCVPANNLENNLSQISIPKENKTTEAKSDLKRAKDIKDNIILNMQELKGVAVVVESHTALIGIRPLDKFLGDGVQLKKEAERLAKETDKEILATSVTTNEHIISMIEELEHKQQS